MNEWCTVVRRGRLVCIPNADPVGLTNRAVERAPAESPGGAEESGLRTRTFSPKQIVQALRRVERGTPVGEICRTL